MVGRAITVAFGVVVVVLTAALVGGSGQPYDTTYGDVSSSFALLEVLVGVALVAAGALLLWDRSTSLLGVLTVGAAAVWLAPVWLGWEGGPELLRAVGAVVAPLLPPVVLAIAAAVPPAGRLLGRAMLVVLAAGGAALTAAASVGLAVVRDPIRDQYCWSDCTVNAFVVHDDAELARRALSLLLAAGVACGVAAALVAAVRLAAAAPVTRRRSGPALAAAALAGIACAGYARALHVEPHEVPGRPLYEALFVARAGALLALAAALAWISVRPRLVRGLVTRLAVDLERSAAAGGLGPVLGGALRDPGLRLGYPIGPGERVVDVEGRPLALDPLRRVTPLVAGDGVVALVESDATTAVALERELGPAAALALGNERLRAEALGRLADASEARARTVDAADAARRRMERDLHDGAQQRLLALTYDLRVALTIAESSGDDEEAAAPLRLALERARTASEELREIAHGIFPAELETSGLEAALESLADVRPLRLAVSLPSGRRYRPDVETAAYAVVVEALDTAHGTVAAELREEDGSLRLSVHGVGSWRERLVHVEDRILAAGGTVAVNDGALEVALPVRRHVSKGEADSG